MVVAKGAKLILSKGEQVQVLGDLETGGDDAVWKVLWVGDLDGDRKLDLYVDLSTHYNVSDRTLFLSSFAKADNLVAKAARFRTVGC
jgi:hypothetical protein